MRTSGVLMHISSLPSPYGIGTFGKEAYRFVDFLRDAGQYYWQILPLCPTGFGDSPYQSFSTFAGNPYFIDLDLLYEDGFLKKSEYAKKKWGKSETEVDFLSLSENRIPVLKKAFSRFEKNEDYFSFCNENSFWLKDYSLYMSLKSANNGMPWYKWDEEYKKHSETALNEFFEKHIEEIDFWNFVQYEFFSQWRKLKAYANKNGVYIIGDIPIYVAGDSADVWANSSLFRIDENCNFTNVAGCPPDAFSDDGQLWGNPLYDWDEMKKTDYKWWKDRISHTMKMVDTVRIDHFRGFESYYSIPASSKTAKTGEWEKGPGIEFFKSVRKSLGKISIIAEDLGFLTPAVKKMLKQSGYPGMKVLQFAFDSDCDSDYLLHNITTKSVCYTGTHDNDTINGYIKNADRKTRKRAKDYLGLTKREGYNWGMMRACWASASDTAIVTMQDLLGLGSEARMNMPSTQEGNWQWRAEEDYLSDSLAEKVRYYTELYKRMPKYKGGKNVKNN